MPGLRSGPLCLPAWCDFTAGDLYAAKFSQQDASNGGTFGITWIKLGSASQSELQVSSLGVQGGSVCACVRLCVSCPGAHGGVSATVFMEEYAASFRLWSVRGGCLSRMQVALCWAS